MDTTKDQQLDTEQEFAVILKGPLQDLKDTRVTLIAAGLECQILRPDCESINS